VYYPLLSAVIQNPPSHSIVSSTVTSTWIPIIRFGLLKPSRTVHTTIQTDWAYRDSFAIHYPTLSQFVMTAANQKLDAYQLSEELYTYLLGTFSGQGNNTVTH
jgi:hypothetical protein